jgi:hypothetical protein
MGNDSAKGMKSAYELALERLESQGIEKPNAANLSAATKASIAEARAKAKSKLAELEIMHRDRLLALAEPTAREESAANYLRDRRRVEENLDRQLEALRQAE